MTQAPEDEFIDDWFCMSRVIKKGKRTGGDDEKDPDTDQLLMLEDTSVEKVRP